MGKSIYISCPVTVDNNTKLQITQSLYNICGTATVSSWVKDTFYYPTLLGNADIVVIVHPDNRFKYNIHSLPVGVRKELVRAVKEKKKIYGAYKNAAKEYNFYAIADVTDKLICLVPGTTADIVRECTNPPKETPVFDVELLTDRITALKKDELLLLLR